MKWDLFEEDTLPLWVADMDFKTAPAVLEALRKRLEHGVFGYELVPQSYFDAISNWFDRRHGWKGITREHIIPTTGVIAAYSACIKAFSRPGDNVIVQTPCYNAFFPAIRNNGCWELCNSLIYKANADIVDAMNLYYGYPDIPIGLETKGVENPPVWIPYHNLAYARTIDSELMFRRSIGDQGHYMESYKLYRKLLSEQPDHSVKIASIGFVTSLARLLESGPDEYSPLSGVELVRRKVKTIYAMGGVFGKAVEPDYNFLQAIDFSLKFFELLPKEVDIVFSPGEVGDPLDYRPEQVIADLSWTDCHPIKWTYQFLNCDTGQKMWDPQAVINAVEGDDLYKLSPRGWVTLTPAGETLFTPDPKGNARYQYPGDPVWCDLVLKYIRLMAIQH